MSWNETSTMPCSPGYVKWIYDAFKSCIVTKKERMSFYFGIFSSLSSNIAAIPQMFTSYRIKRVDGISPFLFSLILMADICGLIGNLNSHILINQLFNSALACLLDGTLYIQFIYYRYFYRSKSKVNNSTENTVSSCTDDTRPLTGFVFVGAAACIDYLMPYTGQFLIGSVFGWISALCYTFSRIPQVWLNFENRKVLDLSPVFLYCAIAGNASYAISVFSWSMEPQYLWNQLPWLVGVIGPLVFDLLSVIQVCIFGYSLESSQGLSYAEGPFIDTDVQKRLLFNDKYV